MPRFLTRAAILLALVLSISTSPTRLMGQSGPRDCSACDVGWGGCGPMVRVSTSGTIRPGSYFEYDGTTSGPSFTKFLIDAGDCSVQVLSKGRLGLRGGVKVQVIGVPHLDGLLAVLVADSVKVLPE